MTLFEVRYRIINPLSGLPSSGFAGRTFSAEEKERALFGSYFWEEILVQI